uniref:Core shell protein Gag P30 domain-containing protein n=1 Tax=Phocoena sinus TaxID=42100 RepID=A0A8C9CLD1_PHOSS
SCPALCVNCSTSQILLAKQTSPPSKTSIPLDSSPLTYPPESLTTPPFRTPLQPPPYPEAFPPPPEPAPAPPTAPPPPSTVSPPTPLASPISAHTRSHVSQDSNLLCPLKEVAGAEGLVRVHVPFSLQDLSQIEKRLGSFSADSSHYIKEFRYLSQAYDLTWHDIFVILSSTLTPDERERIQTAARNHADQVHLTDNSMPVGVTAVPGTDPGWTYQDGQDGRRKRDLMIQCLLAGTQAAAHKVVNFEKLKEITQEPNENPAIFLNRLSEALTLYTRLDPDTPAGAAVLATHFITQSAPDIRKKLRRAEDGPQNPYSKSDKNGL